MLAFPAVMWEDSALIELFRNNDRVLMFGLRAHIESVTGYIVLCVHLRFNMQEGRNSGLCWVFVAPCPCIWTPAHLQPITSSIRQKCLVGFHPLTASGSSVLQQCSAMHLTSAVTLRVFCLTRYRAVAVPLLLILPMAQDCCSPRWPKVE